jgi:hypothetical protein
VSALELARDADDSLLQEELLSRAIDSLTRAASRVLAIDVQAAERHCSRARALTSETEWSPELLCAWANVLSLSERHRESLAVWEKAVERLRAEGKAARAAVEMHNMLFEYETLGLPCSEVMEEALALVRDEGPSPELVTVLAGSLVREWLASTKAPEEVVQGADEILALCRDLGLPPSPQALMARAGARHNLGDEGYAEDVERGLEGAQAEGLAVVEESLRFNSAAGAMDYHGATASRDETLRGLETARRRGDTTFVRAYETQLVGKRYFTGEWSQALEAAQALEAVLLETEDYFDLFVLQSLRVHIVASMGRADEAEPLLRWLSEHTLPERPEWPIMTCVASVAWHSARGERDAVRELLPKLKDDHILYFVDLCPDLIRWALAAQDYGSGKRLLDDIVPLTPLRQHIRVTCEALLAEARGEHEAAAAGFADAAARWHDFGVPYEEAHALLGQGRCLMALGRAPKAAPVLEQARAIFEKLGAKPALEETEKLLAESAGTAQ